MYFQALTSSVLVLWERVERERERERLNESRTQRDKLLATIGSDVLYSLSKYPVIRYDP